MKDTTLTIGQWVHWTIRGSHYRGVVRQIKRGGWYLVQELPGGYLYNVQARHVQP